jgi:putative Holliday junction resolvase
MRVLCLDIGEKRVGLAVGDTAAKIAFPVGTLAADDVFARGPAFRRALEDHEPDLLLIGLPLSLSGKENQQAQRVRELAEQLAEQTGLPLVYQDERLSSAEAQRALREAGCTQREMRGKIDALAASLVLRAYLEAASFE